MDWELAILKNTLDDKLLFDQDFFYTSEACYAAMR